MESRAQNQYDHVFYLSIGNFTWSKKKYIFGGKKSDNKPTEPKNKIFGPKISMVDGRVIYRSIGNFMCCKKQLWEQKKRFLAPFWVRKSCDISID
jgi:hypothetical protein